MKDCMENKLKTAYSMALWLSERQDEFKLPDFVWALAEGHWGAWIIDNLNCRTSLKQMIDFDMDKEEKRLEEWIKIMEEIKGGK
jgi:hypothetical protein